MVQHGEEFSPAASDLAMVLTRGLSMEQQKSSRDSLQYSSGYSTQTNTPSCSEDTIPSQGNAQSQISTRSLQRPVHTKNNKYNTNYIIIHTQFFYYKYALQLSSVALNAQALQNQVNSDWMSIYLSFNS